MRETNPSSIGTKFVSGFLQIPKAGKFILSEVVNKTENVREISAPELEHTTIETRNPLETDSDPDTWNELQLKSVLDPPTAELKDSARTRKTESWIEKS